MKICPEKRTNTEFCWNYLLPASVKDRLNIPNAPALSKIILHTTIFNAIELLQGVDKLCFSQSTASKYGSLNMLNATY